MIHDPISNQLFDVRAAATNARQRLRGTEEPISRVRALLHGVSHIIERLGPGDDSNSAQTIISICETDLVQIEQSLASVDEAIQPLAGADLSSD